MDNLHVRLNFNLSKEKGIKHHRLILIFVLFGIYFFCLDQKLVASDMHASCLFSTNLTNSRHVTDLVAESEK
jgi:hypothetical protein